MDRVDGVGGGALAAAEVVAALRGQPGDGLPDDVAKWSPASVSRLAGAGRQRRGRGPAGAGGVGAEGPVGRESGTEQGEEWELQVEDLLSRLE